MLFASRIPGPGGANTHFHVRLQLRVSRHHVPYVRPVVVLTTKSGARL